MADASGSAGLAPGFAEPVAQSQRAFRAILEAMSRPGRVGEAGEGLVPPAPLGPAAGAFCLTLADMDTPVWLAPGLALPAVAGWLRFHCGCSLVDAAGDAAFALAPAGGLPPLDSFGLGSDEFPDRSTTLVVQVAALRAGEGVRLTGPGIAGEARLAAEGLPGGFWRERAALAPLFPRGLDLVLAAGVRLAALPRTTLAED